MFVDWFSGWIGSAETIDVFYFSQNHFQPFRSANFTAEEKVLLKIKTKGIHKEQFTKIFQVWRQKILTGNSCWSTDALDGSVQVRDQYFFFFWRSLSTIPIGKFNSGGKIPFEYRHEGNWQRFFKFDERKKTNKWQFLVNLFLQGSLSTISIGEFNNKEGRGDFENRDEGNSRGFSKFDERKK